MLYSLQQVVNVHALTFLTLTPGRRFCPDRNLSRKENVALNFCRKKTINIVVHLAASSRLKLKNVQVSLKSVISFYTLTQCVAHNDLFEGDQPVPVFSLHASEGFRLYSDCVHLVLWAR